jgi:hypothetical protein
MNFTDPTVLGNQVTVLGLAVIFGLGVEQATAKSGRSSVGEGSLPEQASAEDSIRESMVRVRIVASFIFWVRGTAPGGLVLWRPRMCR